MIAIVLILGKTWSLCMGHSSAQGKFQAQAEPRSKAKSQAPYPADIGQVLRARVV